MEIFLLYFYRTVMINYIDIKISSKSLYLQYFLEIDFNYKSGLDQAMLNMGEWHCIHGKKRSIKPVFKSYHESQKMILLSSITFNHSERSLNEVLNIIDTQK